jgi:mannose-6-phosphate isomerase-like protein (cupin superfamily)
MRARIQRIDESLEYATDERCLILELANGPDDPAASVARARVAPGITTKLHRVAGTIERYLIQSGQGEVEVQGLAPQVVGPGTVVTIPPGAAQRIRNTGHGDLVFLCICTPRFEWQNYESLE